MRNLSTAILGTAFGVAVFNVMYFGDIPLWPSALGGSLAGFLVYRPLVSR